MNLHGYVGNHPVNATDPSGLAPTGTCTNRGQVVIDITNVNVTGIYANFINMKGNTLPTPLSPGLPSARGRSGSAQDAAEQDSTENRR